MGSAVRAAFVAALTAAGPGLCAAAEAAPRHLRLKNATVDWGSWKNDPATQRLYKVIDPEGGRLVVQPNDQDVKQFGELEYTWDVPATIGADEKVPIRFGGRMLKVPSWMSGGGINLFLGNGLDSDRGMRVDGKYVGRASDGKPYEGFENAVLRTRGLADLAPDTDVKIHYNIFYHVGITYHYEIVSGPPSAKPAGLLGSWRWSTGTTLTLRADGTFVTADGQGGTWDAVDRAGRGLRLDWEGGSSDFLVLSVDGRSLEGKTQAGQLVTAARDKDAPAKPASP